MVGGEFTRVRAADFAPSSRQSSSQPPALRGEFFLSLFLPSLVCDPDIYSSQLHKFVHAASSLVETSDLADSTHGRRMKELLLVGVPLDVVVSSPAVCSGLHRGPMPSLGE